MARAYALMLLKSRRKSRALSRAARARLARAIGEISAAVVATGTPDRLSPEAAALIIRLTEGKLVSLDSFLSRLIASAVLFTINDVIQAHAALWRLTAATHGLPESLVSFDNMQATVANALQAQRAGASIAPVARIVRKNILDASPDLRALVGAGVAQGFAAATIAKQIAKILDGDTPADLPDGITASRIAGLRTVESDATRVAVTEIANAQRTATAQALGAVPAIAAARWTLSAAHPIEDECDSLADANEYGYGSGYYPLDEWPEAPHPYCLCGAGGIVWKLPDGWSVDA
ncbi:MAG TPA: hypothetical protein VII66_13100 [Gemmatimonadaceae bacterium]